MNLRDKVAVVTGAANGIGRALCRRFAVEKAKAIFVADIDEAGATRVASEIHGTPVRVDVSREADLHRLVKQVIDKHGAIDLFCSNAGILFPGGEETSDANWLRIWNINVMAHVYGARAVLPGMLARKQGYLLQTVSAAGLLTIIGAAPYAVTKHAALAFAEWLAITYGDRGIKVSALCPIGVRTDMLLKDESSVAASILQTAIESEQVAEAVVKGLADEKFLILPHPEALEFFRRKASDYDRWLIGMRRLQASLNQPNPQA